MPLVLLARFLRNLGNTTPEDDWDCYDEQFAAYRGELQFYLALHPAYLPNPASLSAYLPHTLTPFGPDTLPTTTCRARCLLLGTFTH